MLSRRMSGNGEARTTVWPAMAGANVMSNGRVAALAAVSASRSEIPSGPGLVIRAVGDDASAFTASAAVCTTSTAAMPVAEMVVRTSPASRTATRSVFSPDEGPSVQVPTETTPEASEICCVGVTDPPPPVTANVTATPASGFPRWSRTFTEGGRGRGALTNPVWSPPPTTVMEAGAGGGGGSVAHPACNAPPTVRTMPTRLAFMTGSCCMRDSSGSCTATTSSRARHSRSGGDDCRRQPHCLSAWPGRDRTTRRWRPAGWPR